MKKFIFSNMLCGAAMTLAVLFFYFSGTVIEPLELKFYDFRAQLKTQTSSKNEIAIIEINDDSISKIGSWPWPRSRVAEMLTWLSTGTARPAVIGLNILFSEPEKNKNLEIFTNRLRQKYRELLAAKKVKETTKESEFDKILIETQNDMDNDAKLAAAIAEAGNVVLPIYFKTDALGSKPRPEPDWMKKYAAAVVQAASASDVQIEGSDFTAPVDILASAAEGIGHINIFSDSDGTIRKEYPLIPYNQNFYPSFSEELARTYLKLKSSDARIAPGRLLTLGSLKIPLDYSSAMFIAFNKSETSFKYYSFYDVINGKIVPEAFKDKIVLIGLTAQGTGSLYVTPLGKNLPAVEFSANVTENILHGHFISKPDWAPQTELGLIVFIGLFITFLLPRLKTGLGTVLAALMLAGLSGAGIYLFTVKGLWVKMAYPSFLLAAGYIFIVTKRFFSTEKGLIEGSDEKLQTGAEMAADIKRLLLHRTAAPAEAPMPEQKVSTAPIQPTETPRPALQTQQPVNPAKEQTPTAKNNGVISPAIMTASPLRVEPTASFNGEKTAQAAVPQAKLQAAQAPNPEQKTSTVPIQPSALIRPKPASAAPAPQKTAPIEKEHQASKTLRMELQPLIAPAPKPGPAALQPAPLSQRLNTREESPTAALSLSPKSAEELKPAALTGEKEAPAPQPLIKDNIQLPIAEALAQPALKPAPMTMSSPDFEKTLPFIYPEEEKK